MERFSEIILSFVTLRLIFSPYSLPAHKHYKENTKKPTSQTKLGNSKIQFVSPALSNVDLCVHNTDCRLAYRANAVGDFNTITLSKTCL